LRRANIAQYWGIDKMGGMVYSKHIEQPPTNRSKTMSRYFNGAKAQQRTMNELYNNMSQEDRKLCDAAIKKCEDLTQAQAQQWADMARMHKPDVAAYVMCVVSKRGY
jgi:hypothetical protein